uniref:Uncharacterized protein n=1 Tax=Euplotes harpa TaxID=151035 RepID=A0A7S3JIY6_9SPIT|mmetsp:Transcript_42803/g.50186  ORF Transcript_42803/g.50186 Transcript_42803/m.50186 type:complete len:158 (+) Transcript_42803:43-516(+)
MGREDVETESEGETRVGSAKGRREEVLVRRMISMQQQESEEVMRREQQRAGDIEGLKREEREREVMEARERMQARDSEESSGLSSIDMGEGEDQEKGMDSDLSYDEEEKHVKLKEKEVKLKEFGEEEKKSDMVSYSENRDMMEGMSDAPSKSSYFKK